MAAGALALMPVFAIAGQADAGRPRKTGRARAQNQGLTRDASPPTPSAHTGGFSFQYRNQYCAWSVGFLNSCFISADNG